MLLPEAWEGPDFTGGDIVQLAFEGADVTLYLPKLPNYRDVINEVAAQTDYVDPDTSEWEQLDYSRLKQIVHQTWKYVDTQRNTSVAFAELRITLEERSEQLRERYAQMDFDAFFDERIQEFKEDTPEENVSLEEGSPCAANNFLARPFTKSGRQWMSMELNMSPQVIYPTFFAPLNSRFYMGAHFSLVALVSEYAENLYTDASLLGLSRKLFKQFVEQIHVEYRN